MLREALLSSEILKPLPQSETSADHLSGYAEAVVSTPFLARDQLALLNSLAAEFDSIKFLIRDCKEVSLQQHATLTPERASHIYWRINSNVVWNDGCVPGKRVTRTTQRHTCSLRHEVDKTYAHQRLLNAVDFARW